MKSRIVVAMSGGVDSSVTAALMAEQGYEVIGITLRLYDDPSAPKKAGSCCTGQDVRDAKRVAEHLGVPHYVIDMADTFRRDVMEDFADSWQRGETPVPCIACNRTVKFRDLWQTARDLGASALATGHYVQRIEGSDGAELHRAVDHSRDQSWFLFATTDEQLSFLRFPLGTMKKTEVRQHAARLGLPVAEKPDSQDICFVPSGGYASVVEKLRPGALEAGDIVDEDGNVLGQHSGTLGFTIGQRRGLDLKHRNGTSNEPLYVLRIEPERRLVVVGAHDRLARREIRLRNLNWIGQSAPSKTTDAPNSADETYSSGFSGKGYRVTARLRSTQEPQPATVYVNNNNESGNKGGKWCEGRLVFDEPVFGVAPGQAGVLYDGNRVLGGGWIMRDQENMIASY